MTANSTVLTTLKNSVYPTETITIVDAKDAGMDWQKVRKAVQELGKSRFGEAANWIADPGSYVTMEYIERKTVVSDMCKAETILLAIQAEQIVGFVITTNSLSGHPQPSSDLHYFAVDASVEKIDKVQDHFIYAAMKTVHELGKQSLSVTYIHEPKSGVESRRNEYQHFFDGFASRFDIITHRKDVSPTKYFQGSHTVSYQVTDTKISQIFSLLNPGEK